MCTLSLYYNDKHIADRQLLHLDLDGFIVETNDLGLGVHSLVSISIQSPAHATDHLTRIPAVVCSVGNSILKANFEPLGEFEFGIVSRFIATCPKLS